MKQRISQAKDQLATSAGIDPLQDRYIVGYLAGMNEFVLADYEEVTND